MLTQDNDYQHNSTPTTGILITNLGTPDAPTTSALRRYLGEFLADPRVVEMPRWIWMLMLHGFILRFRPSRSAKSYAKVWTENGSPLLHISRQQQAALQQALGADYQSDYYVELGMRYGQPSIADALERLRARHVQRLLVIPLYPQYSSSASGSTFDAVSDTLKTWRRLPDVRFVSHYHTHPAYIQAMGDSIREYWQEHGQGNQLLFSFHGIPESTFLAGDPYHCECHQTGRLVAENLGLHAQQWQVTFQSRFGRDEWLTPATDKTLQTLGKQGVERVDVVCPGFSADCLETLEEIDEENRAYFLNAGGKTFHYIPALNDRDDHIDALRQVILQHSSDWLGLVQSELVVEAQQSEKRAEALKLKV
jgi:ferrochelatase